MFLYPIELSLLRQYHCFGSEIFVFFCPIEMSLLKHSIVVSVVTSLCFFIV